METESSPSGLPEKDESTDADSLTRQPAPDSPDPSNGYEAEARTFLRIRDRRIGASVVLDWARTLTPGAAVLELGCGAGVPISEVLLQTGAHLHAIDASPTLLTEFRRRFPEVPALCETGETSAFFERSFDAVVAWGLMFLLTPPAQITLIAKVAHHLLPGGQFLFTAPPAPLEWRDALTDRASVSLGREVYSDLLRASGMTLLQEREDEGQNHYFVAVKG